MKKTPTRKIDLDLENSIFSHDQSFRGELSETFLIGEPENLRKLGKLSSILL
jgi:hypothetical protein